MSDLPLTHFQEAIERLILKTPPPAIHCARSAINHLRKAWEIKTIDLEMSAFRSITAVEESTLAIFHSLKIRKYIGANKLNLYNHVHKASLRPFLIAIQNSFAESDLKLLNPVIEIRKENDIEKVLIRITVPDGPRKGQYASPIPPLNFSYARNNQRYHFTEEIQSLVNLHNSKSIGRYVKELANKRNILLYASNKGIPKVREFKESSMLNTRDIVFQHLAIYLMIISYSEKQLFVQECLESFLKIIETLKEK